MRVSYRVETPYSPTKCSELVVWAFENQATVRKAPNWMHAPHIVQGTIRAAEIQIYHTGSIEDTDVIYLNASIVANGMGAAIVGEFSRSKSEIFMDYLAQSLITLFLIGFSAFIAYGVWKDARSNFTPALIIVITLPILISIVLHFLWRRWSSITPKDTQVVRDFIERAILIRDTEETEQDGSGNGG